MLLFSGAKYNIIEGTILRRRLVMEKIINLCREGSCCPVIRITDEKVEIGESGNTCILTKEQWETLKEKVLNGEV